MSKNKIKILFISGAYPPAICGIGDYMQLLATNLSKINNLDVNVLTSSFYNTKKASTPVKIMPIINNWKLSNMNNILNIILHISPDIVHIQYPTVAYKKNILFNLLPFLIKKKSSFIKIINTFHEPINELSLAGKIRMFPNILFSDGFVFVEKEAYQRLPFFLKNIAKNKKIVFIPVASNIPKIEINKNYKNKIIKKYHLTPKTKLIITFGFINKIKNYEILFNVYNQKKHSWLHIGDLDKNNLYQMEFLKKALKSNINIKFTGYVEKLEVAKLLACADVCVFPFIKGISTRHATFMAAVIQNSYVIATHKNKIGFKKKQNVFYIPPNNIEYLKKAFEFNPGKSRHKKNDFSTAWQKIAEQHLLFYKKII